MTTPLLTPSGVTAFAYQDHEVRTILRDGEPWWVAKDVCEILGISNPSDALTGLDPDERDTLDNTEGISKDSRAQALAIINEPGLYSLILRSRKPEARQFKRWVTHEVLPQIRKTGSYQAAPKTLVERARMLLEIAERQAELEERHAAQERHLARTQRVAQAALDKAESNFGMFSVLGFARLHDLDCDVQIAAKHGTKIANICKGLGITTGRLKDPRFGYVNTYPEQILTDYFQAQGMLTPADAVA